MGADVAKGRPIKLDEAPRRRFVKAIEEGNVVETAAQLAGLNSRTVYRYLGRARAGEREFSQFSQAFHEAQAKAEATCVARIQTATKLDWRAASWLLERRRPEVWGQKIQVTVEAQLKDFLGELEKRLDAETYARVLAASHAALGERAPRSLQAWEIDREVTPSAPDRRTLDAVAKVSSGLE